MTTFKRYAERNHRAYYEVYNWVYNAFVYRLWFEYTMQHESLKEMNQ